MSSFKVMMGQSDMTSGILSGISFKTGEGESLTLKQALVRMAIQALAQEIETDFKDSPETQSAINNYVYDVMEKICMSATIGVLTSIANKAYTTSSVGQSLWNPSMRGKKLGLWVEQRVFSEKQTNDSLPDIYELLMEIKAHSGEMTRTQPVAGVTVRTTTEYDNRDVDINNMIARVIALYKMFEKMPNFMMFDMEGSEMVKGSNPYSLIMHFESIILYYKLILKKLWDVVFSQTQKVFIGGGALRNPENFDYKTVPGVLAAAKEGWKKNGETGTIEYQRSFEVLLNLEKIDAVYKWTELYLYQHNILEEIKMIVDHDTRSKYLSLLVAIGTKAQFVTDDILL